VIGAYLSLAKRIESNAHVNRLRRGVYVDRRLRGARDRDVSRTTEERFYLNYCSAYVDSVEEFTRPWHGDGGENAQNAERESELYDCERVSHQCCPSVAVAG